MDVTHTILSVITDHHNDPDDITRSILQSRIPESPSLSILFFAGTVFLWILLFVGTVFGVLFFVSTVLWVLYFLSFVLQYSSE